MSLPVVTAHDTVLELLAKAKRRQAVPLRKGFVQQSASGSPIPGPLSGFIRRHDGRALDLYLLALTVASHEPFDVQLEAGVWARALGVPTVAGRASVSRGWRRLSQMRLITRRRERRRAVLRLLCEDGSGQPYLPPGGTNDRYLKIPSVYWTDEWYTRLTLPAKAMLLIALSLQSGFYLPREKAPAWYGVSPDTAERGLGELNRCELLSREEHIEAAPLIAQGWRMEYRYYLNPQFTHREAKRRGGARAQRKEAHLEAV